MLRHGFEAPVLAHFDGDHGQFDAENARNEWHGKSVLDLVEEATVRPSSSWQSTRGSLDQLVQLRSRGDHALGDFAFGHALKLGDQDQGLNRFLKGPASPPAGGA